ncbi:MAG: hypothetical protein IK147_02655 [Clostridia bacterium]|nr:hypothetical protein [Clostridia bacterium]
MFSIIHENKKEHCIYIEYPIKKANFIYHLLFELNIKDVSVFIDENNYYGFNKGKKYSSLNKMTVDELLQSIRMLNKDLLIFDEKIDECYVDKELELFKKSKIMINIDIKRSVFMVFINTLNTDMTLQKARKFEKTFKKT